MKTVSSTSYNFQWTNKIWETTAKVKWTRHPDWVLRCRLQKDAGGGKTWSERNVQGREIWGGGVQEQNEQVSVFLRWVFGVLGWVKHTTVLPVYSCAFYPPPHHSIRSVIETNRFYLSVKSSVRWVCCRQEVVLRTEMITAISMCLTWHNLDFDFNFLRCRVIIEFSLNGDAFCRFYRIMRKQKKVQ